MHRESVGSALLTRAQSLGVDSRQAYVSQRTQNIPYGAPMLDL